MNPFLAFKISYRALKSNTIRSILTTLGIIIGVAAVIILIALTQGARNMIEEQLVSLGGTSITVDEGQQTGSGVGSAARDVPLTVEEAKAIGKLDIVTHVSPILDTGEQVIWQNRNRFTAIVGVSSEFTEINDWYPSQGNFFNEVDVRNTRQVAVLGKTVATDLFGYQNPVGESIRIGRNSFRIIGVMTQLGQTPGGKDQDDLVLIPYTTIQKKVMGEVNEVENISVSVANSKDVPLAEEQIVRLLRELRDIPPGEPNDFTVKTQQNIIERIFTVSRIMTILLSVIASISLVVGGIGIMNIMLVSVSERTREIGIRMAVGAKEKDILSQFLIEALLLSLAGGLIGIVLGIGGAKISSLFTNWPSSVSFGAVIIAFGFAAVVGIFFGIYPAKKASKLDPIDALRYE